MSQARAAPASRGGQRLLVTASVVSLAALAWGMLALWSASPYARYLDHGRWLDAILLGTLCRVVPQGAALLTWTVPALLYAAAWLLMIVAMMLPTALPVVGILARITAGRDDAGRLLALAGLGYVVAWTGFGLVAHAADAAVYTAASSSPWFATRGWVIGAVILAGAGAFQFSALKYRCLERCRTPFGFVNARWRGGSRRARRCGSASIMGSSAWAAAGR
jgi:predicted metal-binding membrane protein